MTLGKVFALACILGATLATGSAQELRFSRQLSPIEQKDTGLGRLSADQMAVLDALIRRDQKLNAVPDPAHPQPARFSERLLPEERHSAGLDALTPGELARLNALVSEFEYGGRSPADTPGTKSAWGPVVRESPLEVHGVLSLMYGAGSGGYTEMGGSMVVSVDDPAHNFTLLLGYGTYRAKGPSWVGRDCRGIPLDVSAAALPPRAP